MKLKLKKEDKHVWEFEADEEFCFGFLFVMYLFYDNFQDNFEFHIDNNTIKKDQDYKDYFKNRVMYQNITNENKDRFRVPTGYYGWWIDDSLLLFETSEFIAGVITGFDYFNLDFRNYTWKLPFTYENDEKKKHYQLVGYDY